MPGKRINWTQEKIDFIVDKYSNQEMNTYELAKYFGCSHDTIARRLKEQNVEVHKFYEDLTNKRFGKLTVLKKSEKSNRRLYWDCICDCGKLLTVKGDSLRQHKQESCGCLSSKGEMKIANLLQENDIMFITQYRFTDFVSEINNIPYRFDFAIIKNNSLSYLIEFDGEQHYQYNNKSNWNTKNNFEQTKNRDNKKNKYCLANDIPLIRIPYYIKDILTIDDLQLETSKYIVKE